MFDSFEKSYRAILRRELEKRQKKNPCYSQRAFARDLGIRSNRLSEILSGKQGLSAKSAGQIAERLAFPEPIKRLFLNLVQIENRRLSSRRRAAAAKEIADWERSLRYHSLPIEEFERVYAWYHPAILELTKLSDFERKPGWIAERLGISPEQAIDAVLSLKRLGLLVEKDGTFCLPHPNLHVRSSGPSEAITRFHRQVLAKASGALEERPFGEREFRTTFLAIRAEALAEVKARIEEFGSQIDQEFGAPADGESVYCLGIQFFELTKKRK